MLLARYPVWSLIACIPLAIGVIVLVILAWSALASLGGVAIAVGLIVIGLVVGALYGLTYLVPALSNPVALAGGILGAWVVGFFALLVIRVYVIPEDVVQQQRREMKS